MKIYLKIKNNKLVILVLTCFILILTWGSLNFSLNSPITPNNYIINDEVNDKLKSSTYKELQIIWGNAGIQDQGEGVAIDSSGNIYITGNSLDLNMDVLLLSFDKDGNYRWNKTWGGLGVDWGSDIVIDSSDNIYIAGQCYNSTDTNAVILKYDSSGNYVENISWGVNGIDAAYGIVLDSEENIYITGYTSSKTIGGSHDIFLAKFNNTGLEWETVLPGSISNDFGRDLAVDSTDNIYLVGYNASRTPSEGDIVIAKYNSNGDQLWNETWNNWQDQYGYGIEIDSNNYVYVTGYNRSLTDRDIMLLKYNSSGHLQMETSWDGDFVNDIDEGWGIDIDSRDFIYIVGRSEMTSNFYNVTLLKFTSSLDLEWTKAWGGSDHDMGRGILVEDSLDNVYLTGMTISYSADAFDDVFLLKFIEYPPGTFDLESDADDLDQDGIFTLDWTNSLRADNYSLYQYSSYITEYNGTLTLIEETTDNTYPLTGYSNGTYYFIVKADNIIGSTLSNCIKVEVGISPEVPGTFTLSSNAGTPDPDGNFTLSWTSSVRASNYSIYRYSGLITEVNESLALLEEETEALSLPLTGYSNGTYYFIAVAFNNFGNTTSNYININVEISPEEPDDGGNGPYIPGYNLMILIVIIGFVSTMIFYRRLKFK